ncbi:MAG: hypothetical protein CMP39_03935 [Rickettsiales bacterium]|nr:hypothetical protein [Rickettsiales bacterium]|tara:strand:- start:9970 stop:10761 length:792 start_codon:yes stop_codon:yes gene_type:complete
MSSYNPDHLFLANDSTKQLVFIHGFLGEPDDWLPVIQPLQKDYTILALSLYQLIDSLDHVDFEAVCGRIREELAHYGIEKPVLIGYSLGGRIAMEYAFRYKNDLQGLVIESAHLGFRVDDVTGRSRYSAKFKQRLESLKKDDFKQFVSDWYKQDLFKVSYNLISAEQMLRKVRLPKYQLIRLFENLNVIDQHCFLDTIQNFPFSVIYFAGFNDSKYSDFAMQIGQFSNVSTTILAFADHNIHLSALDQFIATLKLECAAFFKS